MAQWRIDIRRIRLRVEEVAVELEVYIRATDVLDRLLPPPDIHPIQPRFVACCAQF